jgi:hypothetical protein
MIFGMENRNYGRQIINDDIYFMLAQRVGDKERR